MNLNGSTRTFYERIKKKATTSHRRRLKMRREDTKTFKAVWKTDTCYVAERKAWEEESLGHREWGSPAC